MVTDKYLKINDISDCFDSGSLRSAICDSHSELLLIYSKADNVLIDTSAALYPLSDSEIMLIESSAVKSVYNASDNTDACVIQLSGSIARLIGDKLSSSPKLSVPRYFDVPRKMELIKAFFASPLPGDYILSLKYLYNVLGDLFFLPNSDISRAALPAHVQAVCGLFREHPEYSYSLDSLAKMTHINKFKLIKDFKKYFRIPPMRYLLETRLSAAKELLLATDMNVTSIAEKTGFSNQNYFIHAFKKENGCSPTQFRNAVRFRR